jgi:putative ABC transport system permease protein
MHASFLEALLLAVDSLRANKLRSVLTLIGIIISTSTLIGVMALIHGMDIYVANSASTMGNDGFRVLRAAFAGAQSAKKFFEAVQKNPQLSRAEFEFIKPRLKLIKEMGLSGTRTGRVSYGTESISTVAIQGNTSNAAVMSNTQVDLGRYLTEFEDERSVPVVFIGADLKEKFFPNADPLGKTIYVDGKPFEVIGTGQPKGSVFGQSQDNYVSIPVGAYFKMYGERQGVGYNFQALNRDVLEQAQDEVRVQMRVYRHLRPQQDDNFTILSSDTLVSAWDQLTGALAAVAIAVVSVFMVVGGVVIMNIMLAVVSERTREIGIRKAVGARRTDIMQQFLCESSMLAGLGGIAGLLMAWGAAVLVRTLTPVPMELPVVAVVVGVSLSVLVGLFFGIYPARLAAKLEPITAMRSES